MDAEDQNILFIHNYCDRWCERCDFTSRCSVFAMEAETSDSEEEVSPENFVRTLTNVLEDTRQLLREKAAEFGIDLEAAAADPELEEGIERRRNAVKENEAVEMSHEYAMGTRAIFEEYRQLFATDDDPMIDEMYSIIDWYHFFIAAKVHRGFHGITDLDGDEEWAQLNDTQSDPNGSIKIALIAIDRSILAWTNLISADNASMIRPQIDKLESIRSLVERKFPNARDFVRPGFDEMEMVM